MQIKLQFQHLGQCLKVLASFINDLPYFVPSAGIASFNSFHAKYKELHMQLTAIDELISIDQIRSDLTTTTCNANNLVNQILQSTMFVLNDIVIGNDQDNVDLKIVVNELVLLQEALYKLSSSEELSSAIESNYLTKKQQVEQLTIKLVAIVAGLKDSYSKTIQLKQLTTTGKFGIILGANFTAAKVLQHKIFQAVQFQTDFTSIYSTSNTINTSGLVEKSAYVDLALCSYLLKPEHVCAALGNKLHLLMAKNAEISHKIQNLQRFKLLKLIRLQRVTSAYEAWCNVLQQQLHSELNHNIITAIAVQQLLTYDQKAYFTKLFKTQTVGYIISAIEKNIQPEDTDSKNLQRFIANKNAIKTKAAALEVELKNKQSYLTAALATATLATTKQTEYQLGQIAATLNAHFLDQFTNVPVIGERLAPEMLTRVGRATGLSFLSITLFLSHKFGYSYQLIATISRILLAQTSILFKAGNLSNTVLDHTINPLLELCSTAVAKQYAEKITWLQETLNFDELGIDELGIIEKDLYINWVTGLGVQLGMTMGENITQAFCGYIGGTTIGATTSAIAEEYAKKFDLDDTSILALKTITHFVLYSYAYSYAYNFADLYLVDKQLLPQAQAYGILGLGQYAKAHEVQQKYRELALKYHPDKCGSNCAESFAKMTQINTAYSVLKKKFQ